MPDQVHALNIVYNAAVTTLIVAWSLLGVTSGAWAIWNKRKGIR